MGVKIKVKNPKSKTLKKGTYKAKTKKPAKIKIKKGGKYKLA